MKHLLVMSNDSLLAATIAARLAAEISPDAIQVTRHELDKDDHQSLVMLIQEGKMESEPIFCSFYSSPYKTQKYEKCDAIHFTWAFFRI